MTYLDYINIERIIKQSAKDFNISPLQLRIIKLIDSSKKELKGIDISKIAGIEHRHTYSELNKLMQSDLIYKKDIFYLLTQKSQLIANKLQKSIKRAL